MANAQDDKLILGVTQKGSKFRPSDWVERIATAFGSLDARKRLRYSPMVRPTLFNGLRCLFIAGSLAAVDPAGYEFVMEFATSNHLEIRQLGKASSIAKLADELPDVA